MKRVVGLFGSDTMLGKALTRLLCQREEVLLVPFPCSKLESLRPLQLSEEVRSHQIEWVINAHNENFGLGYLKKEPVKMFMNGVLNDVHFIPACHSAGVKKYINVLPNCIYPSDLPVPFLEDQLWDGLPEETVVSYSMTKKLSLVQSKAYRDQYDFQSIHLIITAIYGPEDCFDPEKGQVIPSMITKFDRLCHEKVPHVTLWGSGMATREFIYVDDAAMGIWDAALHYDGAQPMNLSSGDEVRIMELAQKVSECFGYQGEIIWDKEKPEGCKRKCLSNRRMLEHLKYRPQTNLKDGLEQTIQWYRENVVES